MTLLTTFSQVLLFADDMKLYRMVTSQNDVDVLQTDLQSIYEWTSKWLLQLNLAKCKTLTVCLKPSLPHQPYSIQFNDGVLATVSCEKDLGVLFDDKLKFDHHIAAIVSKANQRLGLIKRCFKYLDTKCFINLYKCMVRSQLEYAQAVWSPTLRTHVHLIEKVQRRATKCVLELKSQSYVQRLQQLRLPSLVYRRLRGDMIETFKIVHGLYADNASPKLTLADSSVTRGHSFKLVKQFASKNIRQHSFSCRVVNAWNSLPESVVKASSVNSFKARLDKHWQDLNVLYDYSADLDLQISTTIWA